MSTKYLILFWIIALILFTFYCILRLYYIKERYANTSVSTTPNAISYINNIKNKTNITDMFGCENVYDDNIGVKAIGYTNCQNAVADYLVKKYDYTNKYGQEQSLADICPVSTQSDKYSSCLKLLLNHKVSCCYQVSCRELFQADYALQFLCLQTRHLLE